MGFDSYRRIAMMLGQVLPILGLLLGATTANGNYTYTLNTDDLWPFGSGEWTVTIQNAWQGGGHS